MKKFNKKRLINGLFAFLILTAVTAPALVSAWTYSGERNWGEAAGLPSSNLKVAVQNFVRWFLTILGLIAVIMIIIGGFQWMTAAGNEDKVSKAKNIIQTAVIGLIIIIMAWAITIFVIEVTENSTR